MTIRPKPNVKSIGKKLRGDNMTKSANLKKTLLLWQFRIVMLTTVLVLIALYFKARFDFLGSVALIIAIIGLAVICLYLPKFFSTYEISSKNDAIIINYGVFVRISHIMPYSRLIYAQGFSTPMARLFGLSAVVLRAARSYLLIPEIPVKDALLLINSLTKENDYDKEV